MKKDFLIKTYDKTGVTFKHSIVLSKLLNIIDFDQNINGGQGELILKLAYSFSDNSFLQGDVVRVTEYDENDKVGTLIYSGIVSIINRVSNTSEEYIELTCLGLATLLNNIIVYLGSSFTPTLTQDPSLTIKAIIDYFNSKYPGNLISYAGGHIASYGTAISISFTYEDCFNAIKKLVEATSYWRYIDANGEFYFQPVSATATHKFTFKEDLESIQLKEDFEGMVNKVYVERNGGTYVSYTYLPTQTVNGLKEKVEHRTELQDAQSQNSYGVAYLLENQDVKRNLQLKINTKYNIESIKPGDTVSVLNVDYTISVVQILKTSYNVDKMQLYLDRVITFGDMVSL